MREADMGDLAIALKGVKPDLMASILGVISKRAAEGLREDIEMLGPIKSKDVASAQERIMQVVRKLEESEDISLEPGGEDNAVL
jgi:flagellar motor switch protein FliG